MTKVLLASSSPYRHTLLQRLGLQFECANPSIDETPIPDEAPADLVERLSRQKAEALVKEHPHHLIIGSDQVASLTGGDILTKPGTPANATAQLRACSGRSATFYTAVCVYHEPSRQSETAVVTTEVVFRPLTDAQIKHYLEIEQPYNCAGSFKCEGLGISLLERVTSDDPTALIGLPLIKLTALLARFGVDPLNNDHPDKESH